MKYVPELAYSLNLSFNIMDYVNCNVRVWIPFPHLQAKVCSYGLFRFEKFIILWLSYLWRPGKVRSGIEEHSSPSFAQVSLIQRAAANCMSE